MEIYLSALQANVSDRRIRPRAPDRFPFDTIALSMISKGFSIANACLILIQSNHVDEAYGLSRSLVEGALILRFLTTDNDKQHARSAAYRNYVYAYKNYWLHWARKNISGVIDQAEVERIARKFHLNGDPEPALKGWIDRKLFDTYKSQKTTHPIDGEWFTLDMRAMAYASDYFETSQFVHCSQPSLENPERPINGCEPSEIRYRRLYAPSSSLCALWFQGGRSHGNRRFIATRTPVFSSHLEAWTGKKSVLEFHGELVSGGVWVGFRFSG